MKSVFRLLGAAVFLTACAVSKNENGVDVAITRTPHNEVQIKVVSAPAGKADYWLAYYQGFSQAQDRFLQLDVARRVGLGRLSEVLGEKALAADRKSIAIGLRTAAIQKEVFLRERFPQEYELLVGFAEGVNQFIREMPEKAPDLLKNYRQITGSNTFTPDAWEPLHSVAVAQNMAFYLSTTLQEKLMLGQIASAISGGVDFTSSRLASALDLRPIYNTFILDADHRQNAWRQHRNPNKSQQMAPETLPAERDPIPALEGFTLPTFGCLNLTYPFPECARKASFGSNNWVVSREFAGGDTLYLANDPHLRLTFPFNFYAGGYSSVEAGGTFESAGYGLVGVPGILIGHNRQIAWGFTNNPADVDDVYFEMLDAKGEKVWHAGKYEPIESETIVLKVRNLLGGLDEQSFVFRRTPHHGPIFSDHIPEVANALQKFEKSPVGKLNVVAAYRWVGHEPSSEFVAMTRVNRAKNFAQFKDALREFKVGAQNMIYADMDGDIGYFAHANYPVRPYVSKTQAPFTPVIPYLRHLLGGALASLKGSAEWTGFRKQVPELHNPSTGRIVTANNDPFGHSENPSLSGFTDYFGYSFSTGARAQRITDLLEASRGKVTLDTMTRIQTDHVDLLIAAYLKLIEAHRADLKLSPEAAKVADRLAGWNYEMKAGRHEPVLADALMGALTGAYLEVAVPEVDPVLRESIDRTTIVGRTLYHKLSESLHGQKPEAKAQALAILSDAFERVVHKVEKFNWKEVPWGRLNRLHFYNPIAALLPSPPLTSFPVERDGSWETVDVAGEGYGPNFRMVLSLKPGHPIEGITAVPGGNYTMNDRTQVFTELNRWQKGEYRRLVQIP